MFFQKKH